MGTDELTVAASATCLYLLSYCTILQASGDSAHSPQGGGVTSSLGVTGTFPESPSIPSEASGSKLSALGQPEGRRGEDSRVHPCSPTSLKAMITNLKTIPGCGHQTQEPLEGNPAPQKSFGCYSVLLGKVKTQETL